MILYGVVYDIVRYSICYGVIGLYSVHDIVWCHIVHLMSGLKGLWYHTTKKNDILVCVLLNVIKG